METMERSLAETAHGPTQVLFQERAIDQTRPCTIVIFGIGDLALRMVLPALFRLFVQGLISSGTQIIGVGRTPLGTDGFIERVRSAVLGDETSTAWRTFRQSLRYHPIDGYASDSGFASLHHVIQGLPGNRIFYLAVPPTLFEPIAVQLARTGLIRLVDGSRASVMVEKPLGDSLPGARWLLYRLQTVLHGAQVYFVDHYLGKDAVQNLLVLRAANPTIDALLHRDLVQHVHVLLAESEGVGLRGGYYDGSGALRDMIQNHALQLFSMLAMDLPADAMHPEAVEREKLRVLRATRPMTDGPMELQAVRGQYTGYAAEVGHPSVTETFASLRLGVDTPRWRGTPFTLSSGKRLARKTTRIVVTFRKSATAHPGAAPNVLVFHIQPEEGITLGLSSKVSGHTDAVRPVNAAFRTETPSPAAYDKLMLDAMQFDRAGLCVSRDVVEASWKIVQPFLDAWQEQEGHALHPYEPGTWGPPQAKAMLLRDGARGTGLPE